MFFSLLKVSKKKMFRRAALRLSFFSDMSKRFHDAQLAREAKQDAEEAEYDAAQRRLIDQQQQAGSPLEEFIKRATSSSASDASSSHSSALTAARAPRSSLFVPCSNEKALAKIAKLTEVDVFILDLEDSVAPARKAEARKALYAFADSGALRDKRAIVRINSLRTDPMNAILDIECVTSLRNVVEGIGIPKVELGDDVMLREYLHLEKQVVWAFFETPRGILDADKICSSKFYNYGVMGLNDLSAEMGMPLRLRGPRVQHYYAMSHIVTACRAHGMVPLDGVFNDPTDMAGFKDELDECRRFGFDGKTLIHPSQVDPCNASFTPTQEEVEWAERLVRVVHEAGKGVAVLDGKMVEDLHARQAQRALARRPKTKATQPATD